MISYLLVIIFQQLVSASFLEATFSGLLYSFCLNCHAYCLFCFRCLLLYVVKFYKLLFSMDPTLVGGYFSLALFRMDPTLVGGYFSSYCMQLFRFVNILLLLG